MTKTDTPGILDLRDRNYRFAMLNGWFVLLGDAFFNGSIVLASFAAKLGAPNWVIGLLPSLLNAGSMVPQVFIAPYVARLPVKVVLYRRMALLRVASLGLVALGGFVLGQRHDLLLWVFTIGLALNGFFTGFSSLPFWEAIGKTIPMERRSGLFSARNLVGGALAFLAGFLVRFILELPLAFPYPYAILFALGTLAFAYGWHVFGLMDEPPDKEIRTERISLSLPFRDFYFRRFLRVRILLVVASMVEPFYAAYAVRVLGHKGEIGVYLMVYTLSSVLSNLLWVRISRHYGSRSLILIGAALGALAPLLALLLPSSAFWMVFVLQGAYLAAIGVGTSTYLVNLAPTDSRSSYIGLSNTIVGLLAFSPVLGGLLADRVGYVGPMVVAIICYAWALYAGRRLKLLEGVQAR
ncbi:MFS transporter [Meiothermus sp. CFH 77666]|uniref:MFS transporter n=1 Tax=Meiothermus sp. CFH 77666 TaxID=2817942 RepID=UPI001AA03C3B|nr:MFS transporter [Meiothermus sp. CFH 77666]MBO1437520.1 MFS transporter [Meiothermus sp. CFH 77666]